jgi:acetylornithine deacetylase/succinyl-diaminopimelate desuccinylase-like protein
MPHPTDRHKTLHAFLADRESELIELHRALVRIPSINHGDGVTAHEDQAAAVLAEYFASHGVATRTLAAQPGRDNLIADVGDASPPAGAPTLLFMSHTDVVPVGDPAAWSHPPFSADLADGRIWGRGAIDCKMLVACQAFVLACLHRLDLPLRGGIRLIAAADEEAGGRLGFGWLAREHPDLLRAELAICEGGGSTLGRIGDAPDAPTLVSVGCGEKGRYDIVFTAHGIGGHAATPWGRPNPIHQLSQILTRIRAWSPQPAPASPVFEHLTSLCSEFKLQLEHLEPSITALEADTPGFARSLRAQSRMTFTPTILHAGEGSNVIPTHAQLICDSRLLPGQTQADLEAVIEAILADIPHSCSSPTAREGLAQSEIPNPKSQISLNVSIEQNAPASACDIPADLLAKFQSAASAACGQPVRAVPTWCTGATDAHWVRALGVPVYGFQFLAPASDPAKQGIHCIDESIETSALLPCALSLAHFAAEVLSDPSA